MWCVLHHLKEIFIFIAISRTRFMRNTNVAQFHRNPWGRNNPVRNSMTGLIIKKHIPHTLPKVKHFYKLPFQSLKKHRRGSYQTQCFSSPEWKTLWKALVFQLHRTTLLSSKFIFWSSIMYVNCTISIFKAQNLWSMNFFFPMPDQSSTM